MSTSLQDIKLAEWPTGSRYICNPPVIDTDKDTLVFIVEGKLSEAIVALTSDDWKFCGKDYANREEEHWCAMRKGEDNYILIDDLDLYRKWVKATEVAKKLNLLKKEDRITLFDAIVEDKVLF